MRGCSWMRPQRSQPAPGCGSLPLRPARPNSIPALPARMRKVGPLRPRATKDDGARRSAGPKALGAMARDIGMAEGGAGWAAPWRGSRHDGEIWAISFPSLCGLLMVPLSAAVDAAIVGRLGTAQLGGVGLASVFINILSSVFAFLPILATPAVAAAAARDNSEELSTTIARSVWVASIFGMVISLSSFFGADALVAVMKPTEAVRQYAALYIKCLAFFGPASLCFQTLSGVFRGLKDTKTLFWASAYAASTNVVLDLLFVYGLHWGVVGAGAATVLSVWGGSIFLLFTLLSRRQLLVKHAMSPPSLRSAQALLQKGVPLSLRSIIAFGFFFYSSVAVSRLSVTTYAAFEIMRQVFLLAFLSYSPLEYTVQSLCASYLGKGDVYNARNVFQRILQLALMFSSAVGVIFLLNIPLVGRLFTTDAMVVNEFRTVAPFIFACLPLDSLAGILDGALVAGQKSDFVAYANIASALVGLGMLVTAMKTGNLTLFNAWLCIKIGFLGRMVFTLRKLFFSQSHPFALEDKSAGLQARAAS
eukprot:evm.model.scf_740.3 EVM.evm.TU.scf_740.3   scf_740:44939-51254(+)